VSAEAATKVPAKAATKVSAKAATNAAKKPAVRPARTARRTPVPAVAAVPPGSGPEVSVGTDAAFAGPSPAPAGRAIRGVSEIRHFFRTNVTPVYFVGATPFNLLGLDRWVRNFHYVT